MKSQILMTFTLIVGLKSVCDCYGADTPESNEIIDSRHLKSVIANQLPKESKFFDDFDCEYFFQVFN